MFKALLLFSALSFAGEIPDNEAKDFSSVSHLAERFADLNNKNFASVLYSGPRGYDDLYEWQFPSLQTHTDDLGPTNRPGIRVKEILRNKDKIIYNAIYSYDSYGRRVTAVPKSPSQTQFIVMLGCSFTAGKGLNDTETLNYFVAKKSRRFYPYNYGINGGSINSALALVQQPNFSAQLPEKSGLFIYTYIWSHISRASGIYPEFDWMRYSPYYDLTSDDRLIRNGNWWSARPLYTAFTKGIYDIFGNNILKGRQFPAPTSTDYEKFCRMVAEVRTTVEKKKPESKFIFYVHPFAAETELPIETCLKKYGVHYVIGKIFPSTTDYMIPNDGHPNGAANEKIAEEILQIADKELVSGR